MTTQSLGQHYLDDALRTFRNYKTLAERALAQISDEDFFRTIDEASNSIAINIKHMAGNLMRRAHGKHSMRVKRRLAAWDDEFLASLITGQ